ncbi:pyruvate kinase [Calditerrivibrio sp.]|uniref:pyruvate kinase n=1 Tax=Calditerrivibrio sp. TaxID=2792612 RepID=UPI003D0D798E
MKKTKIVATLGPASNDENMIVSLIKEGVDIFRLNFSHGDHFSHLENLQKIRKLSAIAGKFIGVLQDLGGPKIRLTEVEEPFDIHSGEKISIKKSLTTSTREHLAINHPEILKSIKVGSRIYIADGLIRLEVEKITDDLIHTVVLVGGRISSRKGVNFPDISLDIPAITDKDKEDVLFAIKNEFEFIAISFVKRKEDVLELKEFIRQNGGDIPIIAKIEKHEAIKDIDGIIEVSDGIMVARGDLGVEIELEKVPVIQKMIIRKANEKNKPVITATQMLNSMVNLPRPTRAEVSDVANAVLDGTDAVMLSDETAAGKYPLESVRVMKKTIIEAEKIYEYHKTRKIEGGYAIPFSATELPKYTGIDKLVVFTSTGASAIRTSYFRPKADIIANVTDIKVARKLSIVWGVTPNMLVIKSDDIDGLISDFLEKATEDGILKKGEKIIAVMGYPAGVPGSTNLLRIIEV